MLKINMGELSSSRSISIMAKQADQVPSGTEAGPTLTKRHTDSVETITVTAIEMQFQSKEGLQECL